MRLLPDFARYATALLLIIFVSTNLTAQKNTSPKENYRIRASATANTSTGTAEVEYASSYMTVYDNGYVILRDGTRLTGQISLAGASYDKIFSVKIKTNAGQKFNLSTRSLSEFGLDNTMINETPSLFRWVVQKDKKLEGTSGFRLGANNKSVGYGDFGYVNTTDGKKYEGAIEVTQINGRVESIKIKDTKKDKKEFEPKQVKSYGVQLYVDPKFKGPWSLVTWKASNATGILTNKKSNDLPGYVILTDGSKQTGTLTLVTKDVMISQVQVEGANGKSTKNKYEDIQSYGVDLTVKTYYDIIRKWETPFDELRPEAKFFPGTVTLTDRSVRKGLIAQVNPESELTDVYFANDENGPAEFITASTIEDFEQTIPAETQKAYDQLIYNRDHIKGFLKQRPPQWIYKSRNVDRGVEFSKTEFQPGYIILATGEEKIGAISVIVQGMIPKYEFMEAGKDSEKYSMKETKEYGLIVQEPRTDFPERLFIVPPKSSSDAKLLGGAVKISSVGASSSTPTTNYRKRQGYVQLLGGNGSKLFGELQIREDVKKTKTGGDDEGMEYIHRTFMLTSNGKKEEYPEGSVDQYGLVDVPVRELTADGVVMYDNPKMNFQPGSFSQKGTVRKGFIAWLAPNKAGTYEGFYYAEDMKGNANIFYVSEGCSDINQTIEEKIAEYNPVDDSFLKAVTIDKEVKNNGYVITADGKKIEGAIQMSFPPKLWFATDVTLTQADGTVTQYTDDGSLRQINVTIDGKVREFVNFRNEYAEVLQREGSLVHLRNPHPTTPTYASGMLNQFIGAAANEARNEWDKQVAAVTMEKSMKGELSKDQTADVARYLARDKKDYTKDTFLTLYAKEHIVLDETSGRYAMYIPGAAMAPDTDYKEVDGELGGCMEYLMMDGAEQRGLRTMRNPSVTMKFMNACFVK